MPDSNSNASVNANAKMGLLGWLTLLFVILKLNPGGYLDSAVMDWSWWLVFSPILLGLGFFLFFVLLAGFFFGGAALLDYLDKRKRRKVQKATQNMTPAERREYFANKRK